VFLAASPEGLSKPAHGTDTQACVTIPSAGWPPRRPGRHEPRDLAAQSGHRPALPGRSM